MKHHYSIPVEYIGRRVDVVFDRDVLEIYYGFRLVTTHLRDDTPYAYTQKESHGLKGHYDSFEKDLAEIYQRAADADNIVLGYLKDVTREKRYPPLAFVACRGIMSLETKYGQQRLVAACACAAEKKVYGYNEVKEILERGDDSDYLPDQDGDILPPAQCTPVQHGNIRGKEYYSRNIKNNN